MKITFLGDIMAEPPVLKAAKKRDGSYDFRGVFKDLYMYLFLALRHLVLPLVLVGVMRLLILAGLPISESVLLVVTILACTPAASSATMFAEKYDCDAGYASKLVAVSTILCIATMPLVVMVAQL